MLQVVFPDRGRHSRTADASRHIRTIRDTDYGFISSRGNVISFITPALGRASCLAVLLLLAACNSTSKTSVTTQKSVVIPSTATAVLTVKADLEKEHRYTDRAVETLRKQLTEDFVSKGVFRSVAPPPTPGDYQVDIRIAQIRVITPGGRVMFGFMAGRNYVRALVTLRNSASGELVTSFETTGYGASIGWGAQSYGVDDPVRMVVKNVIEKIR